MRAIILILGCIMISCSSAKNTATTTTQSKALERMIALKSFQIESNWAHPLVTSSINSISYSGLLPQGSNVSTINLIGNTNYFKMLGDSISMYLPYYGEQRMGGTYNATDVAIQYNGVPKHIEIIKNDKKQVYEINFLAKSNRESYRVFITLSPGLTSDISINSSHRTTISYRGVVSKLSEENNKPLTVQ